MTDIAKLRELLAKASPGPWSLSGIGRLLSSDRYCIGDGVYGPDADFILAMYQALPELLAIAEGAEADRADAIGELQSVEHSMKAGGQTLVTYRVLDTNYDAPMRVRIVSLDAALAGAVTHGEETNGE